MCGIVRGRRKGKPHGRNTQLSPLLKYYTSIEWISTLCWSPQQYMDLARKCNKCNLEWAEFSFLRRQTANLYGNQVKLMRDPPALKTYDLSKVEAKYAQKVALFHQNHALCGNRCEFTKNATLWSKQKLKLQKNEDEKEGRRCKTTASSHLQLLRRGKIGYGLSHPP